MEMERKINSKQNNKKAPVKKEELQIDSIYEVVDEVVVCWFGLRVCGTLVVGCLR